jgi:hypothetical protein
MAIYQVWHINKRDPIIRAAAMRHEFKEGGEPILFPDHYIHVANVDSQSLDGAYTLTNHIDSAWFTNEEVEVLNCSRSTSVGDVVVDRDGEAHRCKSMGWEQIKVQEERHDIR